MASEGLASAHAAAPRRPVGKPRVANGRRQNESMPPRCGTERTPNRGMGLSASLRTRLIPHSRSLGRSSICYDMNAASPTPRARSHMNTSRLSHPVQVACAFHSDNNTLRSRMLRARSILALLAGCLMTASAGAVTVAYYGGLSHAFPGPGVPPAIDSFFDVFFELEISAIGPGSQNGTAHSISYPLTGSVQVLTQPDSNFDGVFATEVLSLNLSGGGILIRESPTLASTGTGVVTPGGYYISSFFDVFTELSIDGGVTWQPSTAPLHITRVPEAGSTGAMMLVALGILAVVRRKLISE
jgi:hypothetical protein